MAGIVITGTDTDGIVLSNPATDDPATVTATGSVTNQTGSHDYDAIYGAPGYSWTVANLGTIEGVGPEMTVPSNSGPYGVSQGYWFAWYPGAGVHLTAGGVVTNGQSGSISGLIRGGTNGVDIAGGTGNVTNFGTIESLEDSIGSSVAVLLQAGGSVENFGTISGPMGIKFSGTLPGTVTNAGTINGAVQFGDGDDRLIVDPGAVFIGTVDGGGGSDVLELVAGTGNKTLSGLGTNFVNFEKVVFDANAGWTVTLDDPFTGTISGFAAGDILDLTGRAASGVTYSGGVLTVQNGGAVVATFNLAGSYTSSDFSVAADGHGGTDIGIAAARPPDTPTAINGSVTTTENHTVSGSVTSTGDADNDVAYIVDEGPAHGTLTSFNGATGAFTYTPATNYFGSDSFKFHAVDEPVSSNQATESITVNGLPPTGITFVTDSAHLATLQVEGSTSGLHSSTAIGTFTETGGISGDAYSFTLGGASGFSMSSASNVGTLSIGGSIVSGLTNGRVYPLTVTVNDTTNSTHSAALPFDVVVGSGRSDSNGNDTIKLDIGSGNLGISATTPTIVYGLNGNDAIIATGMTANVWFVGGPGADTMTGGTGINSYIYAAQSESGSSSIDTITNFLHGFDKIDFSALALTNTAVSNTTNGSFANGNTTGFFSSQGTGIGIVAQHVRGAEQVYVDVNHDGNLTTSNDMIIHLNSITANLTNTDFIV